MNNYKSLTKVQLLGWIPLEKLKREKDLKNRIKQLAMALLLLYGVGTLPVLFYLQAVTLTKIATTPEMLLLPISNAFFTFFILGALGAFAQAIPSLFPSKGQDSLAALPITLGERLWSSLTLLYLSDLLLALLLLTPPLVVYFQHTHFSILGVIMGLLGLILAPLLPLCFGVFVSLLLHLLTHKLPYRRLLTTLFNFILFAAFMLFTFTQTTNLSPTAPSPPPPLTTPLASLTSVFGEAFAALKPYSLLLFMGLTAIVGCLTFTLLYHFYPVLDTHLQPQVTRKKIEKGSHQRPPLVALMKKDMALLFNQPSYAINALAGLLMLIISVFFLLRDKTILLLFQQLPFAPARLCFLVALALSALASTTTFAATSISLEGVSFPLLKSLPISPFQIMLAKAFVQLLFTLPLSLISFFLLTATFSIPIPLPALLLSLLFLLLQQAFSAGLGLIFNLLLPVFTWKTEVSLATRSISSMLGLFVPPLLLLPLVYFVWTSTLGEPLTLLVPLIIQLLLLGAVLSFLKKTGSRLFSRLP